MRAATVEALTPLPLASSANCFFHASKPAAVLPHCAASALLAIHTSAAKAATVTVLNCPPLVIQNPLSHLFASDKTPFMSKCSRAAQQGHHEGADVETVRRTIGSQPIIRLSRA